MAAAPPAMAAVPPLVFPQTLLHGIVNCGVDNAIQPGLGMSPAQRIATQTFMDNFQVCVDLSDTDLDSMFKTFALITQAQG